jgi:hypothetical protein
MTYPKACLKNTSRRTLPAICTNCARSCKYAGRARVKTYPVFCAWCGAEIGKSTIEHSHGICGDCYQIELEKANKYLSERWGKF